MNTLGDRLVDTYVICENKNRVWLQLPNKPEAKHMFAEPVKYIFQDNAKHKEVFLHEGFIPSIRIRHRFMLTLRAAGNNGPRIYLLLNAIMQEQAIKMFFPDLWLVWHNKMAHRKAAAERQQMNIERKYRACSIDRDHGYIRHITTCMSMDEAAQSSRCITRR